MNVRVRDKDALESAGAVWAAVDDVTRRLGTTGRVLVRPSGTEPLVRVMAEAGTQHECDEACQRIVDVDRRGPSAVESEGEETRQRRRKWQQTGSADTAQATRAPDPRYAGDEVEVHRNSFGGCLPARHGRHRVVKTRR